MHKLYTIVDKNDNILGYKTKSNITNKDLYRVSGLLIYNSKNEVLLAKRALTKKHNAGKWGMSAAGAVEEGETYEQNIIKEAREEIGFVIDRKKLITGSKTLVESRHIFYYQQFFYKLDATINEFTLEPREVEQVKWFNLDELIEAEEKHPEAYLIKTVSICKEFMEKFV